MKTKQYFLILLSCLTLNCFSMEENPAINNNMEIPPSENSSLRDSSSISSGELELMEYYSQIDDETSDDERTTIDMEFLKNPQLIVEAFKKRLDSKKDDEHGQKVIQNIIYKFEKLLGDSDTDEALKVPSKLNPKEE